MQIERVNPDGLFKLNAFTQVVTAEVPARVMHAYATDLRSLTGGRGQHTEKFSHYEDMPKDVEKKVIADAKSSENGGA